MQLTVDDAEPHFRPAAMVPDCEVYYRVRVTSHANGGYDMQGEWEFSGSYNYRVCLEVIPVVNHTPKGVWLGWGGKKQRLVLHSSKKRFADPTIEKAINSAVAKKQKHIYIMQYRVRSLQNELSALEGGLGSWEFSYDDQLAKYYEAKK